MRKITLVKIGGHVLDQPEKQELFLEQFASLEGSKVLVHGGGIVATRLAEELGIPVRMQEGRRITDDQMIDIVVMAYSGLNKRITAALQHLGSRALGLTGADADLVRARKRPPVAGIDYGWVGDPIAVNAPWLDQCLQDQLVPVIAPLTHDGTGHLLNTNADTMAQMVAVTLSRLAEVQLVYAFDLSGVMAGVSRPDSLIRRIDLDDYHALRQSGIIHSGMLPKLDNAFAAVKAGVSAVSLIRFDRIHQLNNPHFNDYTRLYQS